MLPAVLARLHPEFGGFHPRFTAGFEMCLLSSLDFLIQKSAVVSKERCCCTTTVASGWTAMC